MTVTIAAMQRRMSHLFKPEGKWAQMPIWADDLRALPISFAQSALFTVGGKHPRARLTDHPIAALGGDSIRYSGEELRLDEQDLLLQLFHLARGSSVAVEMADDLEIRFSGAQMLRALGWQTSTKGYERLHRTISRLQGGSVQLESMRGGRRVVFKGQLVRKYTLLDDSRVRWTVWLEPEVVRLFIALFHVEWAARTQLTRPLSKWMHGFIASAMADVPGGGIFVAEIDEIHRLSGSRAEYKRFRQSLRQSLSDLVRVGVLREAMTTGHELRLHVPPAASRALPSPTGVAEVLMT